MAGRLTEHIEKRQLSFLLHTDKAEMRGIEALLFSLLTKGQANVIMALVSRRSSERVISGGVVSDTRGRLVLEDSEIVFEGVCEGSGIPDASITRTEVGQPKCARRAEERVGSDDPRSCSNVTIQLGGAASLFL